jgi:RNA methyltransferase, TrmH family
MGTFVRITQITSKDNPRIKQVRSLKQRSHRVAAGLFIVEGIRHVGEAAAAAEAGKTEIEAIYYAPELLDSEFALQLIEAQAQSGTDCFALPASLFTSLADKEHPQGIMASVRLQRMFLNDLNPNNFHWGVALVAPQDPGNIGAILRTIDAVGASGLLLLDSSADPTHPSAVRASMGTLFWLPVVSASFSEFTAWAKEHSFTVYGTSANGSSHYQQVQGYNLPLVLLMGSEREGLTSEQASVCQQLIRLPMEGRATSLNLAVATGVFLYEIYSKISRSKRVDEEG